MKLSSFFKIADTISKATFIGSLILLFCFPNLNIIFRKLPFFFIFVMLWCIVRSVLSVELETHAYK